MITRRERVSTGRSNRSTARELQQQEETSHPPPQSAYQLPSARRQERGNEANEQGRIGTRERLRTGMMKFDKASDLVRHQMDMETSRSSRQRSLPLVLESLFFRRDKDITPQEISRIFYDAGIRIPENSANEILEHYKLTDIESDLERQLLLQNAMDIAEQKSSSRLLTTSSGTLSSSSKSDETEDWDQAKRRSKSADLWISLPNFAHAFDGAPRMRTISEESQKNKKKFLEKRSFSVSDIGKRLLQHPPRDNVIKPEESSPSFLQDEACLITVMKTWRSLACLRV